MAERLAARVKETSTTTGTGTLDLAGAETGFQTFVDGVGDTKECYYLTDDGTDWEVGLGTVTDAATDTLSRDLIIASSNAGAAVNWGAGSKTVTCTFPEGVRSSDRVHLRREEVSGNSGGTLVDGEWSTVEINTEVSDPSGVCSLASDQFTLQKGTYEIRATVPLYGTDESRIRLRNITDSTTTVQGCNARPQADSGEQSQTCSVLCGRFSISASKAFEIQVWSTTTVAFFSTGKAASFGDDEVFMEVEIHRVNPFGEEITLAERVKETSTTTGTGTFDLAGAETGFQTFVDGVGDTNKTGYFITDGTDWEIGVGTVTDAGTDTLSRDDVLASSNGDAAVNWGAGSKTVGCCRPPGVETHDYVLLQDQKSNGVQSASITSGGFRQREVNTEVIDTGGVASIASDEITLEAGVYEVFIQASSYATGDAQLRLQNITDAETTLLGMNAFSREDSGEQQDMNVVVHGRFEITAQKTFEIQHRIDVTSNVGRAVSTGEGEVYLVAEFRRVGRAA